MISLDFSGRTVLVTGGANGIGKSVALRFAEAGADVGVIDLLEDESNETVGSVRELGRRGFFFQADVTSEEQVNQAVASFAQECGRIDFFVNSAAVTSRQPFLDLTLDVWQKTLSINLTGAFLCCKAVVPHMVDQKQGRIVLISSGSAMTGSGGGAHYASSKGGMLSLVRTLAREFAKNNILVNCLAPRNVLTPLIERYYTQQQIDEVSRGIPLGRFSTPEEIANVALYLCSDLSTYMTGQFVIVDGGRTFSG